MKIFKDYLLKNNSSRLDNNIKFDFNKNLNDILSVKVTDEFQQVESVSINNFNKDNLEECERLEEYERRRSILSLEL